MVVGVETAVVSLLGPSVFCFCYFFLFWPDLACFCWSFVFPAPLIFGHAFWFFDWIPLILGCFSLVVPLMQHFPVLLIYILAFQKKNKKIQWFQ